jgi:hypothetical protein
MDEDLKALFTAADHDTHEMIEDISNAADKMDGDNQAKALEIVALLEKAHSLIHDLKY